QELLSIDGRRHHRFDGAGAGRARPFLDQAHLPEDAAGVQQRKARFAMARAREDFDPPRTDDEGKVAGVSFLKDQFSREVLTDAHGYYPSAAFRIGSSPIDAIATIASERGGREQATPVRSATTYSCIVLTSYSFAAMVQNACCSKFRLR